MALTHISIVVIGLLFAQLSDEAVSEQATLANLLASASEAQEVCSLPGEASQMMGYVRQVQPSFDVVSDPGDAHAMSVALLQVKASIRKMGVKSWCDLYVRERQQLWRTKALPECEDMPGLCRSMVIVRGAITGGTPAEKSPPPRPPGLPLSL